MPPTPLDGANCNAHGLVRQKLNNVSSVQLRRYVRVLGFSEPRQKKKKRSLEVQEKDPMLIDYDDNKGS